MNYPRRRAAGYQKEIINRPKGRGINPLSASGGLNIMPVRIFLVFSSLENLNQFLTSSTLR